MSFYAYPDTTHTPGTEVQASAVQTPLERAKDYYCPGCNAVFRHRSMSSNGRKAHFYLYSDRHDASCWMPYAMAGTISALSRPDVDFDPNTMLDMLRSARGLAGHGIGTTRGTGSGVTTTNTHLSTLRNLYKYCCLHADSDTVNGTITVRDIFVARKTAYFYTHFVNGVKLIEASFSHYYSSANHLYFNYPYDAKTPKWRICVEVPDHALFKKLRSKLFGSTNPVLIYSQWKSATGCAKTTLENDHQIILL